MCLNEGMFKGAKVVAHRSRDREDSRQPNLKRAREGAREGGDFEIASKGWEEEEEEKCTENELCYAFEFDPHSICGEMLFC